MAGTVILDEKSMAGTKAPIYLFGDGESRNVYRAAITVFPVCRLSVLVRMES